MNLRLQMRQAVVLVAVAVFLGAGCGQPIQYQPPPPPSVTVAKPLQQTVVNYLEETGTTEAVERVDIRARVKGFLETVNFEPGSDVEKGELLYVIQPGEFEAKVAAAKADLKAKSVELKRAEIEYQRQQNLLKENATSEAAVVQAEAEKDAALAAVDASRATLDQAQLDLDYTQVTSPIDGRVGKTLVKVGNLVGDGQATLLTTVISYDPIYANFNISERDLLELTEKSPRDPNDRANTKTIKVQLRRAVDDGYPFEGHVDYADLAVDQSTGTFLVRGIFPNTERRIVPGLFVRVRIPLGTIANAKLVPERAVGADQAGRYVLIVNSDNIVERRNVTPGAKYGEMVVVTDGLAGDESVVVDGILRARPGAEVKPKTTELPPVEKELEFVQQASPSPLEQGDELAPE